MKGGRSTEGKVVTNVYVADRTMLVEAVGSTRKANPKAPLALRLLAPDLCNIVFISDGN